ncbi:MAG TPA: hypothetical protein VEH86_00665 [Candidatus Acidoferrum sp.]|nr:hypothetical protein [Candidatus Acidoferrum sp.]
MLQHPKIQINPQIRKLVYDGEPVYLRMLQHPKIQMLSTMKNQPRRSMFVCANISRYGHGHERELKTSRTIRGPLAFNLRLQFELAGLQRNDLSSTILFTCQNGWLLINVSTDRRVIADLLEKR